MDKLVNPSVQVLLLFSARSTEAAAFPHLDIPSRLNLQPQDAPAAGEWRYRGTMADGTRGDLCGALAHDTWLLRLTLTLEGEHSPEAWNRLYTTLQRTLKEAWEAAPEAPHPWAATWLYLAFLPNEALSQAQSFLETLPAAGLERLTPDWLDATPYGWLSLLGEDQSQALGFALWQRRLLLLIPQERSARVQKVFLEPLNQGLTRIELHLQKARHHLRQRDLALPHLEQINLQLLESVALAARTGDFARLHQEQRELEEISRQFLQFQVYKAYTQILLHTLQVNLKGVEEHLQWVKLDTPTYSRERAVLARAIEQLENDLRNVETVSQSAYLFQDIQRGVEANRLERASFLMSATAVILAGVAIFNSFLDIWTLSLEGSPYLLPPAWVRIPLGLMAGASLPLAAYSVIERRTRLAILWSIVAFLVFLLAVVSTVWVN